MNNHLFINKLISTSVIKGPNINPNKNPSIQKLNIVPNNHQNAHSTANPIIMDNTKLKLLIDFPFISTSKEGIKETLKKSEQSNNLEDGTNSSKPSLDNSANSKFIDLSKPQIIDLLAKPEYPMNIDIWLDHISKKEESIEFNEFSGEWSFSQNKTNTKPLKFLTIDGILWAINDKSFKKDEFEYSHPERILDDDGLLIDKKTYTAEWIWKPSGRDWYRFFPFYLKELEAKK